MKSSVGSPHVVRATVSFTRAQARRLGYGAPPEGSDEVVFTVTLDLTRLPALYLKALFAPDGASAFYDAICVRLGEHGAPLVAASPDADPTADLARAVAEAEAIDPLPRCRHENALRDGAGEDLAPSCGCTFAGRCREIAGALSGPQRVALRWYVKPFGARPLPWPRRVTAHALARLVLTVGPGTVNANLTTLGHGVLKVIDQERNPLGAAASAGGDP